ncbi:TPA: hypothetical protein N2B89_004598 [Pseudomonas aeruginosa]|uniref:hypothetical protein n=1 Tax=Pseudomonas aeruginosa TaxID=287 RepID=UPI000EAB4B7A|nr:hypothetical protein [Pseudomonas aeruginosa]ELD4447987.1 hypothetical protein [Pseudomonas aeruginosa]EMB9987028.1 hypothetical protein [Pseudomonas aeruginosa]MCU8960883.1 hypothetical protein [Pseudomonas aeruginosa]MCU9264658.1 hypothetical protein [Pseudomonas aeruginosa]MDV6869053.1 hypothetical protein [Pseudomonas aeruginosa]
MTRHRSPFNSGFIIDKPPSSPHGKAPSERRDDIWLWFYLALRGKALYRSEAMNPRTMSEQMAESIKSFRLSPEEIAVDQSRQMVSEEHITWISNCKRQLAWIQHRLNRDESIRTLDIYSSALTKKEMLIAKMDCSGSAPRDKESQVIGLKQDWDEQTRLDKQLSWVQETNEAGACRHVVEWMRKHQPEQEFPDTVPKTLQDLLIASDAWTWSDVERKYCISTARRLWRQALRRKKAKGKKQYNFILSDKAIKRLDRFSKDNELSRARVLEILLQMEEEKDLYLKEQIRVLRGVEH